jgi:hypothetical protein
VCHIISVISPAADYILLSNDSKTITVDPTKMAPINVG